jgi:hypothetical protein
LNFERSTTLRVMWLEPDAMAFIAPKPNSSPALLLRRLVDSPSECLKRVNQLSAETIQGFGGGLELGA